MFDLPEWLYEYLMAKPQAEMLEIMYDALDNMQSWNGRSSTYCIAMASPDIEIIEDDDGKIKYRIKMFLTAAQRRAIINP